MPDNCSTTVPSITSRVRSKSSRMPFCVMSCQIVSESEIGNDTDHRQRDPGLLGERRQEGEGPVKRAGTKSRKLIRRNLTNPSALRLMPPVQGTHLVLTPGSIDPPS